MGVKAALPWPPQAPMPYRASSFHFAIKAEHEKERRSVVHLLNKVGATGDDDDDPGRERRELSILPAALRHKPTDEMVFPTGV
jgi:hypothetical protein